MSSAFGIEFGAAVAISSVSLFADSIDFLEDASVNLLIFAAMGWAARRRAVVGMLLAGILLIPSLAALWTAWQKLSAFVPPEPFTLTLVGEGHWWSMPVAHCSWPVSATRPAA